MRLPDFICIGAMRCGTSTLWELMRREPRIYLPERKELHFFDNCDGAWDQGLQHYAAHFQMAEPQQVCGEVTPSYLFLEEVGDRIRQTLPDARLVVILRDPVERAWSHYCYMVRKGVEPLSFKAALDAENERLLDQSLEQHIQYSYATRGHYIDQLRRYEQTFSREQLLVVFLEDLKRQPTETMRHVLDHLGLSFDGSDRFETLPHRNKQASSPRWRRMHYWAKRADRWSLQQRPGPVRKLTHAISRRLVSFNLSEQAPVLKTEIRHQLRERFAESDRQLAAWLGRPLPWRPNEVSTASRAAIGNNPTSSDSSH